METITITKANALKAYKAATESGKKLLSDLVGKDLFSGKITDRIKTVDDAFDEMGIDRRILDSYPQDVKNFKMLTIICAALNEEWIPNWKDGSQRKWYPWFQHALSGFGFSGSVCTSSHSAASVGARLCFKSEELANYAGRQFEALYNAYLTELNP